MRLSSLRMNELSTPFNTPNAPLPKDKGRADSRGLRRIRRPLWNRRPGSVGSVAAQVPVFPDRSAQVESPHRGRVLCASIEPGVFMFQMLILKLWGTIVASSLIKNRCRNAECFRRRPQRRGCAFGRVLEGLWRHV